MKSGQLKFAAMVLASALLLNVLTLEKSQAQFSLGLKVAGNAVNYKKVTERDFGLEAGVFLRFGSGFFFQPEVNYSFKRSTFMEEQIVFEQLGRQRQAVWSPALILRFRTICRIRTGPPILFNGADSLVSVWTYGVLHWMRTIV